MLPLVVVLVALGGCSGTPLGTRLGNSFGPVPTTPEVPTANRTPAPTPTPAPAPAPAATLNPTPSSTPTPSSSSTPTPTTRSPAPRPVPTPTPAPAPTATVPYRVVLRLPRTDPAAPAEALTQALRAADLPFEVETIEKLQAGDEGQTRGR